MGLPVEQAGPSYWGIWVNGSLERKVMRELKCLGISQASIEMD